MTPGSVEERRVRRPRLDEVSSGLPTRRYGDPDLLEAVRELEEKNQALRGLTAQLERDRSSQLAAAVELDALRNALKERDALLKETHHRVKNNLQVVTSLLRLEAGRAEAATTRATLKEMQGRIASMSLLHETLYQSGTFGYVDLADYLRRLATQAFKAHNSTPDRVRLTLDLHSHRLAMDRAIPCGLLVNELLTNSLKYAFPEGRPGEVTVSLDHQPDGQARIEVSDNGVGLPADIDARRARSLGLQLVSDLALQLGGRLDIGAPPGASFAVTFRAGTS